MPGSETSGDLSESENRGQHECHDGRPGYINGEIAPYNALHRGEADLASNQTDVGPAYPHEMPEESDVGAQHRHAVWRKPE